MAESFYGVLGVGPDADSDEIDRAYRDAVTECHPDVSDESDACERFKRLTAAKETLLDATERERYDRLGHERYLRHRGGCPGWTVPETANGGADRAPSKGRGKRRTGDDRADTAKSERAGTGDSVNSTRRSGQRARADGGASGSNRRTDTSKAPFRNATATTREAPNTGRRVGIGRRVLGNVGAWLLLDVLLLAFAVGLAGFGYSVVAADGTVSLSVTLLLGGEVALALVLVSVHTLTTLSR